MDPGLVAAITAGMVALAMGVAAAVFRGSPYVDVQAIVAALGWVAVGLVAAAALVGFGAPIVVTITACAVAGLMCAMSSMIRKRRKARQGPRPEQGGAA